MNQIASRNQPQQHIRIFCGSETFNHSPTLNSITPPLNPDTLSPREVCSRIPHFTDLCHRVHLFLCRGGYRGHFRFGLFPEIRKEIHLEGLRQAHRRSECDIDVAGEKFRDIRTGHFHALRQLGLIKPQPLHLNNDAPQKCAYQVVRCHR